MNGAAAAFAVVSMLSVLVAKLVDLIRNAIDTSNSSPKYIWNLFAFVFGITVALVYQVDLLAGLGHTKGSAVVGRVITGLVIGGGSSFAHEIMDALSGVAKRTTT